MEYILILTSILVSFVLYLYIYIKNKRNYWKCKGLESFETMNFHLRDVMTDGYNTFKAKKLKHGGLILLLKPLYFPIDLDIIKSILIKNFDYFPNHSLKVNEELDPLSQFLPALRDDKWRNLRNKLTPAFTSGKMKMMLQTMVMCTDELKKVIEQESKLGSVDITDLLARFTTDIIGSVAFGINCNSLKDPNTDVKLKIKNFLPSTWRSKLHKVLPTLATVLRIRPKRKETEDFFINLTKNIIDYRESKNIYKNDFMNMMLQLKNRGRIVDDGKIMDDDNVKKEYMKLTEVAAHCFIFFSAGFETSSTLMTYALLELAQHKDIQEKLRQEMNETLKKYGEKITYEAIMDMNYLDQVVHETLRKHPPIWVTDRQCIKDCEIPGTDLVIERNTQVIIPIRSIHYNPDYYPEPDKFIPERFSPKNKAKRHHFAFLPFGEGPRKCIGARFALLQSKVGLTSVLTNFDVKVSRKTKLPIKYNITEGVVNVKGDVWLDLTKLD